MNNKPIITDSEKVAAIRKKQSQGKEVTKNDILDIKDSTTRQKLIVEFYDLFRKE